MKLFQKLENLLSAAAFAEGGDVETARQMIADNDDEHKPSRRVTADDVKLGIPRIKQGQLAPKA